MTPKPTPARAAAVPLLRHWRDGDEVEQRETWGAM
jgi:hypothetical protein